MTMPEFSRLVAASLAYLAIGAAWAASPMEHLDPAAFGLTPEEAAAIASSIESSREISARAEKVNGRPYRRDAHAKATGCLRAVFSVNGDIPELYRHSVFSEPAREYEAWVRFSNGDFLVQKDSKPDARGMAFKVMGVEGGSVSRRSCRARPRISS